MFPIPVAGGFRALASREDIELVRELERSGARIAWSAAPRVLTSSRTNARAKGGFGDAVLIALDIKLREESLTDSAIERAQAGPWEQGPRADRPDGRPDPI